jgi:hypothetical protein
MNRGRVGEERGGKEMDGCPLTGTAVQLTVIRQIWLDHPPSIVFGQSYPNGYRTGTEMAIV